MEANHGNEKSCEEEFVQEDDQEGIVKIASEEVFYKIVRKGVIIKIPLAQDHQ